METANPKTGVRRGEGCLVGTTLGCGLLVVAGFVLALIVYINLDAFATYIARTSLAAMENRLAHTETGAHTETLTEALAALRTFVESEELHEANLDRYRLGARALGRALEDKRITDPEAQNIRDTMTRIGLFRETEGEPPSVPFPSPEAPGTPTP